MKLITEQIEDVQVITEGTGADKKLYIEGVFLQSELKNRNVVYILSKFWSVRLDVTTKVC